MANLYYYNIIEVFDKYEWKYLWMAKNIHERPLKEKEKRTKKEKEYITK